MSTNSNAKAKFTTVLLQAGKTATGIKIPPEIIEKFGAGKKPPVRITINGFTYRSTVAVMNGAFMVGVNAENRIGAKVNGGDEIEVHIDLDTKLRDIEIPADFQKILNKNTDAMKRFSALSYSKQKEIVGPIKDAKTEETRQKRIEKGLGILREKNKTK